MSTSRAQRAATAERRAQAVKLRMAGARLEEIAAQLHYASRAAACKDIKRALEQAAAEQSMSTAAYRAVEVDRLDRLQRGLWMAAVGGDYRAADTVRRIIADRCRLLGVDVPPDLEERIRREMTVRVGAQMATVWGRVLDGLGLTDEQAARVPALLDAAISAFTAAPPGGAAVPAIEGSVVEDEAA